MLWSFFRESSSPSKRPEQRQESYFTDEELDDSIEIGRNCQFDDVSDIFLNPPAFLKQSTPLSSFQSKGFNFLKQYLDYFYQTELEK